MDGWPVPALAPAHPSPGEFTFGEKNIFDKEYWGLAIHRYGVTQKVLSPSILRLDPLAEAFIQGMGQLILIQCDVCNTHCLSEGMPSRVH